MIDSVERLSNAGEARDVDGIRVASGDLLTGVQQGSLCLPLGTGRGLTLERVMAHPLLHSNLLSCSALLAMPEVQQVVFDKSGAEIRGPSGDVLFTAELRGGLYVYNPPPSAGVLVTALTAKASDDVWHRRLGHFSYALLQAAAVSRTIAEGPEMPSGKRRKAAALS